MNDELSGHTDVHVFEGDTWPTPLAQIEAVGTLALEMLPGTVLDLFGDTRRVTIIVADGRITVRQGRNGRGDVVAAASVADVRLGRTWFGDRPLLRVTGISSGSRRLSRDLRIRLDHGLEQQVAAVFTNSA